MRPRASRADKPSPVRKRFERVKEDERGTPGVDDVEEAREDAESWRKRDDWGVERCGGSDGTLSAPARRSVSVGSMCGGEREGWW